MDPSFTYVFTKGNAAQAHTMDPSVFILRTLWNYTHFHLQSNVWSSCCNLDEPCTHSLLTIVLVFRRPLVTHSSLIQQKLVSIWKLPLWTFPLKTTIFSVLLFSTYLLTSGNVSKRSFKKLLYTCWGQGKYFYWKFWMLPHGEQMRAINPGNSQSENTL